MVYYIFGSSTGETNYTGKTFSHWDLQGYQNKTKISINQWQCCCLVLASHLMQNKQIRETCSWQRKLSQMPSSRRIQPVCPNSWHAAYFNCDLFFLIDFHVSAQWKSGNAMQLLFVWLLRGPSVRVNVWPDTMVNVAEKGCLKPSFQSFQLSWLLQNIRSNNQIGLADLVGFKLYSAPYIVRTRA